MPDWLPTWIKNITLSDIANVSELIGLTMTFYVFYTIRKIKNYYVFKARVPELTQELSGHASKLSEFHNEYKDSQQLIILELGRAEVTLKSLKGKVGRPTKKSISGVMNLIEEYKRKKNKDNLWGIYVELQKVIQEVATIQGDRAWENYNG